jgi:hypothetical protein
MFKDMKGAFDVIRSDDLKELKKKADAQPKVSMLDGVKMANQAMDQAQVYQDAVASQGLSADPMANMAAMSQGVQGNATVKSTAETGQQINGTPVYEVVLTVQVPGQEAYDVTHKQVIALAAIGNWQPGAIFPVRVDPNNPQSVIIG